MKERVRPQRAVRIGSEEVLEPVIAESSAGGGAARLTFATLITGDWAARPIGERQNVAIRSLENRIIIYFFCDGGVPAAATGAGLPAVVFAAVVPLVLLFGLVPVVPVLPLVPVAPLVPFGPAFTAG